MNGEDVSLARIAELVEFDQAIAAAALLHDIGKLVMSRCLNASVETIVSHARQAGVTFVEAEQQLFAVNHAVVGADTWLRELKQTQATPVRA